jgi:hypothetical protein
MVTTFGQHTGIIRTPISDDIAGRVKRLGQDDTTFEKTGSLRGARDLPQKRWIGKENALNICVSARLRVL